MHKYLKWNMWGGTLFPTSFVTSVPFYSILNGEHNYTKLRITLAVGFRFRAHLDKRLEACRSSSWWWRCNERAWRHASGGGKPIINDQFVRSFRFVSICFVFSSPLGPLISLGQLIIVIWTTLISLIVWNLQVSSDNKGKCIFNKHVLFDLLGPCLFHQALSFPQ